MTRFCTLVLLLLNIIWTLLFVCCLTIGPPVCLCGLIAAELCPHSQCMNGHLMMIIIIIRVIESQHGSALEGVVVLFIYRRRRPSCT